MTTRRLQSGYSLMELVIYIALFALLSIVLMQSLVSVVRTYAQASRYRILQNNGELVLERITREIRDGSTLVSSTCVTNPGTLTITDSASHTAAFSVTNNRVQLALDGASAEDLSTDDVVVTTFTVCPITTPIGSGAKVILTLTTTDTTPATATFYTTTLIRK